MAEFDQYRYIGMYSQCPGQLQLDILYTRNSPGPTISGSVAMHNSLNSDR